MIMYFNSRPHEEVDERFLNAWIWQRNFNSRPHEEVDLFIIRQCNTEPYFNSRPHEEVDCHCPDGSFCRKHFNSRPHEEVDRVNKGTFRLFCISTHDLTRRSTEGPVRIHTLAFISTHDLTRRSTAISYNTTSFKIVFFVLILYF